MKAEVYIALGSNLGDREKNLLKAVELIGSCQGVEITRVSHIYETEPVGYEEQGPFLNMVLAAGTNLEPLELLEKLQEIENSMGRKRTVRWGPRTIDLDILLYGCTEVNLPSLTLPHPRMWERAFVLVPLREICPEGILWGRALDGLIDRCPDRHGVKLYRRLRLEKGAAVVTG